MQRGKRFFGVPGLVEQIAQVEMRGDIIRLRVDGRAKMRDRADRVAECVERHAEIVVRARVARP